MGEVSQRSRGNSLFARFASGSEPFILTAMASLLGKEPVPAMRDLYSRNLQTVSNGFLSLGVAGQPRES